MNKTVLMERIENLCRERGITLNTAFIESGVGKNFKSNLKNANPTMGKITMLSMYFNVSREYLTGESDKRGSYIRDVFEISGINEENIYCYKKYHNRNILVYLFSFYNCNKYIIIK